MTSTSAPILRPAPNPLHGRVGGRPRLALSVPVAAPVVSQQSLFQAAAEQLKPAPSAPARGPPSLKLNTSGQGAPKQQYSVLNYAIDLQSKVKNSPDHTNLSAQEERRSNGIDGGPLDIEQVDDDGLGRAIQDNRIVKLGSLGEGAGGAVTRCILKDGKTLFALKVITTDPNPDVIRQIKRELKINRDCASPWICKYYASHLDVQSATISIAMEFCEGGSLDSIYREVKKLGGRTGEKVLGKIAEGVLNGLTYLSDRKIIHRDIKPSNILITRRGQVKLCDFGVSGELLGSKGDANTFIGTSAYMAPERIQGLSYTITSDVWSLGVTLLEVAQNSFPFRGESGDEMSGPALLIELLTSIVTQPIPELKDEPELGITWTEEFKYFIACCLEKDTARRASPWRMLEHPWIQEMKVCRVNMSKFLAKVWEWKD